MRIAEFAFAQAKAEGRKKITAVHKANIMKLGDAKVNKLKPNQNLKNKKAKKNLNSTKKKWKNVYKSIQKQKLKHLKLAMNTY
jgi:hypothetical protein